MKQEGHSQPVVLSNLCTVSESPGWGCQLQTHRNSRSHSSFPSIHSPDRKGNGVPWWSCHWSLSQHRTPQEPEQKRYLLSRKKWGFKLKQQVKTFCCHRTVTRRTGLAKRSKISKPKLKWTQYPAVDGAWGTFYVCLWQGNKVNFRGERETPWGNKRKHPGLLSADELATRLRWPCLEVSLDKQNRFRATMKH